MARYILINLESQAVLGQKLDNGGVRAFVSIAEAYETLAKLAAHQGTPLEQIGTCFNSWVLHEVRRVEGD